MGLSVRAIGWRRRGGLVKAGTGKDDSGEPKGILSNFASRIRARERGRCPGTLKYAHPPAPIRYFVK